MYTSEKVDSVTIIGDNGRGAKTAGWEILDPQGTSICVVFSESEAEALLSHLNR